MLNSTDWTLSYVQLKNDYRKNNCFCCNCFFMHLYCRRLPLHSSRFTAKKSWLRQWIHGHSHCGGYFKTIFCVIFLLFNFFKYFLGVETVGQSSAYKVKILHDNTPFLATPVSISRATHLYTASSSAACGIHLQIGSTYLMKSHLSGKDATNFELHANLCTTYAKHLMHVPTGEEVKELFADLYKIECHWNLCFAFCFTTIRWMHLYQTLQKTETNKMLSCSYVYLKIKNFILWFCQLNCVQYCKNIVQVQIFIKL